MLMFHNIDHVKDKLTEATSTAASGWSFYKQKPSILLQLTR